MERANPANAFALLFNTRVFLALSAGVLAAAANNIRLFSIDVGLPFIPAAFIAALISALLAEARLRIAPLAASVAPIIIMVLGMQAFQALTFFSQKRMLDAVQALASCRSGVSALAMDLAAVRFFKPT